MGNVKLKHSLDCGDYEMVEFEIFWAVRRAHSKLITLDSRRAAFISSRVSLVECHGIVSWKKRGTQESWMIFKDCLLQAHKQCITTKRKSGKKSTKFAWMNKELLDKQVPYRGWKKGQVSCEEYRKIAQTSGRLLGKLKHWL